MINFTKDYLARIPVTKLPWKVVEESLLEGYKLDRTSKIEDANCMILDCQDKIMKVTVLHPLSVQFPLPRNYNRIFLKTLISKVEDLNCEVHSDILEWYTNLLSESDDVMGHRTFLVDSDSAISLKENVNIISDGTTGLCTWQAAFHLAEWCLANSSAIDSKVVVELGSGAGLVGLTCYKKCNPKSVIVTDFHPKVLETLQTNVQMNSAAEIQVSSLDWVEFAQQGSSNKLGPPPDVVLASDVVFDADLIPDLVATLSRLLLGGKTDPFAVVACTVRNEETLRQFKFHLGKSHLCYSLLPHAAPIFSCERQFPVEIYQIKPMTQSEQ